MPKRDSQAPAAARNPDRPKRKYRRRQLTPPRAPPVGVAAANASAGMEGEAAVKGGFHLIADSSASTGAIPNEYGDEGLTKAGVQTGQQMQLQEVMSGNGREHARRQVDIRFHDANDINESSGGIERRAQIETESKIVRTIEYDPPPADTRPHSSHRSNASLMQHSRANQNHANPVCLFPESHPALISTQLRETQVHKQQLGSLLTASQYPAGDNRRMETTQTQVPNISLSWNSVGYPFGPQAQLMTDDLMSSSVGPTAARIPSVSRVNASHDYNAAASATGSGRELFDVNMETVRGTPYEWQQAVSLRQMSEEILHSELRRATPDIQSPVQQKLPLIDLKAPAARSSNMSSRHAAPTQEESIQQQCDPRARQNADSALVSHTLSVEPIFDSQYDLCITTVASCSSFVCVNSSCNSRI